MRHVCAEFIFDELICICVYLVMSVCVTCHSCASLVCGFLGENRFGAVLCLFFLHVSFHLVWFKYVLDVCVCC